MPDRADLPDSLAGLARRNALRIQHENFGDDAGRLVAAIERVLAAAPSPGNVPVGGADVKEGSGARWNDPARAVRLLGDAERIANSITDKAAKASALSDVAAAVAATAPPRCPAPRRRRAHRQLPHRPVRGEDIGAARRGGGGGGHRPRTRRRVGQLPHRPVPEGLRALSDVAAALAATRHRRAERIANSLTDVPAEGIGAERRGGGGGSHRPRPRRAHRQLPHRRVREGIGAERRGGGGGGHRPRPRCPAPRPRRGIANSIADGYGKASALSDVAAAVAATRPPPPRRRRAHRQLHHRRLQEGIGAERRGGGGGGHRPRPRCPAPRRRRAHRQLLHRPARRIEAVRGVAAAAMAATDPDLAERIANSLTSQYQKVKALIAIVRTLAA